MVPVLTTTGLPPRVRPDVAGIQWRTLRLLFVTQIIGGIGVTIGVAVGALLAADLAGTAVAGVAQSAAVVGAALLAVPITRLMVSHGRRPGLAVAYLVGAAGGVLTVLAAVTRWVPLLFVGMLLFGGGSAANLQARYAAVDLAEPARRGRQLSLIVWATTIGAVAAPNFAALTDEATAGWGLPRLSGPFAFSAVAFVLTAGVLLLFLRPDPLLTARRLTTAPTDPAASTGPTASTDPPASTGPTDPSVSADPPAPTGSAPADPPASADPADSTGPADPVAPADLAASVDPGTSVGGGSVASADPVAPAGGPVVAKVGAVVSPAARTRRGAGVRTAWSVVRHRPAARLGIAAVAVGHLVMVAVMVMTPVRLHESHTDAEVLPVVGLVLSLHIAGMYALAPVVGWLTDRLGRRAVILGGAATLLAACVVAGTAGHDTVRLTLGLVLLGLGWSATMVAGSTLLSESVPTEVRPTVQGLSDLTMGLAGAGAGAASGFVMQVAGYPTLALLAAVALGPLVALALRPAPPAEPAPNRVPDEEE
ncbi:MFS transporter [Micromonospora sp. WMMA1923]|uniref:MFS transporter n=1 Tax=Micromonospora sp. WMMA1923 TaxID=3404125 RepID=UPI003B94D94A